MLLDTNTVKENCLNEIKEKWLQSNDSFPLFLTEIPKEIKSKNEQYIETIMEDFQNQLKSFPVNPMSRKKWKQKTLDKLVRVLYEETILSIHQFMDQQTIDIFLDELKDFLRHVRNFAPKLSLEDIGQAIRNYIVYAMFNELNQMQPGFNIAAFGYSMLYPFTDNYIDSPEYSDEEKQEYNQLIRDKILGKEVHPKSSHQLKTCDLLQTIASEYPREIGSSFYALLLMILEAQEYSIQQQKNAFPLTMEERLDISLYKGGVSVLIDGFFVKKEITKDDLDFYFGFGFFLQLADDLQDIKEDSMKGNQTLFTEGFDCQQEEKIVNKMLHFLDQILDSYQGRNDSFRDFILLNCHQLIYSSILKSKEYFSKAYLDKIEPYFPVTFFLYESKKNNKNEKIDRKIQDNYIKILDELIF